LATKQDLQSGLATLGYQMTIRLGGMIAAAVAILGVLIPVMFRLIH